MAKFFDGYGRIIDCRVMTGSSDKRRAPNSELTGPPSGFGFVEFESSKVDPFAVCRGASIPIIFRTRRMLWITSTASRSWEPSSLSYHNFHSLILIFPSPPQCSIVVEFAKESRPRRDVYEGDRGYGYIS